ncbi:hypothetical protein AB0L88_30195 [Saccharopolyspora shandongensis]|uniref:WXG100 family type VII secretion target n=1 Tax=Saccharopolyspora shandongensis TaxID=418495 RepID=A0A1H3F8E5_9PSEU|nr:hypothetical protein [Saccharopolyspora shandongensis]SDX86474.1 hypothetical protein SAMN05216215_101690 [Saccharopolyspora shandongensis]
MSGFRSDIGQLTKHAGDFDGLAGEARRIADTLRQALDAAGDCWGGDDIGENFARTHCDRADQALDGLGALSGQLGEMGAKFAATAATTERADTGGAEELGRLVGRG